jgi:hypothetical protein
VTDAAPAPTSQFVDASVKLLDRRHVPPKRIVDRSLESRVAYDGRQVDERSGSSRNRDTRVRRDMVWRYAVAAMSSNALESHDLVLGHEEFDALSRDIGDAPDASGGLVRCQPPVVRDAANSNCSQNSGVPLKRYVPELVNIGSSRPERTA